jgi:hypothetical protein
MQTLKLSFMRHILPWPVLRMMMVMCRVIFHIYDISLQM